MKNQNETRPCGCGSEKDKKHESKLKEVANDVKDYASKTGEKIKNDVKIAGEKIKEGVHSTGEKIKEGVRSTVDKFDDK